jgi:hypothetical protein
VTSVGWWQDKIVAGVRKERPLGSLGVGVERWRLMHGFMHAAATYPIGGHVLCIVENHWNT